MVAGIRRRTGVRSSPPPPRRSKVRFAPTYFCLRQKISHPPAHLLLLLAKSHARLACSVVNALTTAHCRYQLFANYEGSTPTSEKPEKSFSCASHTSLRTAYRSQRLFYESHFSLILSQLLSKSNPLSLGLDSVFYPDGGIFLSILSRRRGLRIVRDGVFLFKANAVSHSLRRSSSPRKAGGFAGAPNISCISLAACIFAKATGARSLASPLRKKSRLLRLEA